MGSIAQEEPDLPSSSHDEITVLVTGFGPFRAQYPINPSWEIAHALPPFLPPPFSSAQSHKPSRPVRILVDSEAVRVSYDVVRSLVPKLWDGEDSRPISGSTYTAEEKSTKQPAPEKPKRRIDYMLHIGMATGRNFYSIERRGHRDGYHIPDVDGVLLNDESRRAHEGDKWIWHGVPKELLSGLNVDDVWRRWKQGLPNEYIRVSEDAGRYLCDFIYFSSLAHLWKRGEERRVLFLHVPVDSDVRAIQRGMEVTLGLVGSMVDSGEKLGVKS